jgi:hypothetical protein
MKFKLPRHFPSGQHGGNVDALNYEILQESAATLARLGRRLQGALDALAAFDAAPGPSAEREPLLAAAGEALWYYVVQREVMGLGNTETVLRDWGIPRDVRLRMGIRPRPAT